ncbi:MAG: restriction endonuclease subunit S [Methylobacter sp.]|nr:restriction endonuclease subunit S [Methylobacter sp.]
MNFDFSLPEGWHWTSLESIKASGRSIVSGPFGSNIGKRFFVESGIPIIRGNNLSLGMGRFNDGGFVFLSEEKSLDFKNCEAIGDDLIFTAAGTIGQVGIIPRNSLFPKYIISNKQLRARLDLTKAIPLYVYYWLASPPMVSYIQSRNTGSTIPLINLSVLRSLPIPLPPLKEQEGIVDVLSTLDDRITLLRETNTTLEAIAQALFKSWFVDFDPVRAKQQGREPEGMDSATAALFPDSFEESELGLVPRGWQLGNIGQIAEIIDCLHSKKPELIGEGWPFLQLSNIRNDGLLDTSKVSFITEADYIKWISRIEVSKGDCVITNVGRVGAVAQIPTGFKAAMGRNMTAIRPKSNWPYPTYLIELLQSSWMRTEINRRTDVGTILDALNVRNIPNLRCMLAPNEMMVSFESTCRPLRAAMEANFERINSLVAVRDTLLPRLISGQLHLPEASPGLV